MTNRISSTRTRRLSIKTVAILAAAALLLTVTISTGLRSDSVRHQLALSFTRLPAGYSQLYFADQPVEVARGTAQVRFAVGNQEQQLTRYSYRVVVTGRGKTIGARTGSVEVPAGQTRSVTGALPVRGSDWSDVTVSLVDRPETIRFLRSSS